MPDTAFDLAIDYAADGSFATAGDERTADVKATPGMTFSRGRDQLRALAPARAGALTFDLKNAGGEYSPGGSKYPAKGLLARVTGFDGATTFNLFTGILERPNQAPVFPEPYVKLGAIGTLSRLAGVKVSTALYSNITTGTALDHLLDAVGWPAADRVLDTGQTTLLWWWLDEEDAFTAMNALLATEGAGSALYEDGQGRIVFKSRHARVTESRSTTSQDTIDASGSTNVMAESPVPYDDGIKDVVNVCTIEVKTRTAQALAAIWTLGQTLTLGSGDVRKYRIKASGNNPFTAALDPVASTDYTLDSGSLASIVLDRTSGANATLTITAGAGGAVLSGLQVRAQAVTVTATTSVSNTVDTSASQTANGVRSFKAAVRAEIELPFAQDLCNGIVQWYENGRPQVRPTVVGNYTADAQAAALEREIGDRVTVINTVIGINADFWIEHVTHQVQGAAPLHKATFGCEQVPTAFGPFIIGTSELDDATQLIWF